LVNIFSVTLIFIACGFTASCSRNSGEDGNSKPDTREERAGTKPAPGEAGSTAVRAESQLQPDSDQIEEDCLRFVRSTRTVSTKKGDCPDCPATEGTPVLEFVGMHVEQISPSGPTCNVAVTLRATFIPSTSQEITDGLVGWIPPEQRSQFLHGETPSGEQVYRVMITYSRDGDEWRAVEFERR
jgi:hypothetical protein